MSNFDVLLCDVIALLAQVFIVSFDRAYNQSTNQSIFYYPDMCISRIELALNREKIGT